MKIGILTLPLLSNYGAFLQNFALQETLKKLGYSPITIDKFFKNMPLWRIFASWIKTLCFRFMKKERRFVTLHDNVRSKIFDAFAEKYICKTTKITELYPELIQKEHISTLIVGSDQVWRPKYSGHNEDMFLKFAENLHIKRVAYAASFGVDNWEYSPEQTRECCRLAKKFDAISVREQSGVKISKENLGVDATWVLDPTLLLKKEDYLPICDEVPVCNEKYLAVYVLDENEEVVATCEKEANARGLVIKKFQAGHNSILTVPEWLAMFRDASYVVTDSFHGTVFSIIFGKEFKCIYNKERGIARFESLMNLYNSGKINEMREFSIDWLKKNLKK